MREEELSRERLGDGFMMRKFLAVVRRQCMHPVRQGVQKLQNSLAHGLGSLVRHLDQQGQPGLPLYQRDQHARVALADDRVQFPVTDSGTPVHDCRALVDGGTVRNPASAVVGAIALPAKLLAAQVSVQLASAALVAKHVQVDPLMADTEAFLLPQPQADLLGTPVLPQQALHPLSSYFINTAPVLRGPARHGQPVRLRGPVPAQPAIPPQLSADRGAGSAQLTRYRRLAMTCFHEGVNLISLFLGKLRVASHRAPLSCREGALMLPQLALSPSVRVALTS